MRKIITLVTLLITLHLVLKAQVDTVKTKHTNEMYSSFGFSMTNNAPVNSFAKSSYISLENGLTHDNLGLGLVLGRGSLFGIGRNSDNINDYYYEIKNTVSFPIGYVTGTVLFGGGSYFSSNHSFIEYGIGISYSACKWSYGITYSNWDGTNYVTPNITYNF